MILYIENAPRVLVKNYCSRMNLPYIYIVGFICKPLKEYKLVNLIIVIDQNNQGIIWINMKYGNMKYMES